jgi:hypothetical protein
MLGAAVLAAPVHGQGANAPAIPSLSGSWAKNSGDGFPRTYDYEQPLSGPGPLVNTSGDNLLPIGNSDSPILQPWAAALVKAHGDLFQKSRLAPDPHTMCLPMGVPFISQVRDTVQFLQTPDWVTMIYENNSAFRFVHMNAKHSAHPEPTWFGESVGHYEGDTLVIDTIGITTHSVSSIDRFGTPHTAALHVVERYHTENGGKMLRADFMVEDPGTFTTKWNARTIWRGVREAAAGQVTIATATKADF